MSSFFSHLSTEVIAAMSLIVFVLLALLFVYLAKPRKS
jgi:hypothetical protein